MIKAEEQKGFGLAGGPSKWGEFLHRGRGMLPSELFKFISSLNFIQLCPILQFIFQPRKVLDQSSSIADMTLSHSFLFDFVFDGFGILYRRASYYQYPPISPPTAILKNNEDALLGVGGYLQ